MDFLGEFLGFLVSEGFRGRWRLCVCIVAGVAAIIALWWLGIAGDAGWRSAVTAATFIVSALIGCVWEFGRPRT